MSLCFHQNITSYHVEAHSLRSDVYCSSSFHPSNFNGATFQLMKGFILSKARYPVFSPRTTQHIEEFTIEELAKAYARTTYHYQVSQKGETTLYGEANYYDTHGGKYRAEHDNIGDFL